MAKRKKSKIKILDAEMADNDWLRGQDIRSTSEKVAGISEPS